MHPRTIRALLIQLSKGVRTKKENANLHGHRLKNRKLSNKAKQNIINGIRNNRYTPEYAKKLSQSQTGSRNNQAKLTENIVKKIRQEYVQALKDGKPKTQTQYYLAQKYGVKRPTISDIVLYKTWKHLILNITLFFHLFYL